MLLVHVKNVAYSLIFLVHVAYVAYETHVIFSIYTFLLINKRYSCE